MQKVWKYCGCNLIPRLSVLQATESWVEPGNESHSAALRNTYQNTDVKHYEVKTNPWTCLFSSLTSKSFLKVT